MLRGVMRGGVREEEVLRGWSKGGGSVEGVE